MIKTLFSLMGLRRTLERMVLAPLAVEAAIAAKLGVRALVCSLFLSLSIITATIAITLWYADHAYLRAGITSTVFLVASLLSGVAMVQARKSYK